MDMNSLQISLEDFLYQSVTVRDCDDSSKTVSAVKMNLLL